MYRQRAASSTRNDWSLTSPSSNWIDGPLRQTSTPHPTWVHVAKNEKPCTSHSTTDNRVCYLFYFKFIHFCQFSYRPLSHMKLIWWSSFSMGEVYVSMFFICSLISFLTLYYIYSLSTYWCLNDRLDNKSTSPFWKTVDRMEDTYSCGDLDWQTSTWTDTLWSLNTQYFIVLIKHAPSLSHTKAFVPLIRPHLSPAAWPWWLKFTWKVELKSSHTWNYWLILFFFNWSAGPARYSEPFWKGRWDWQASEERMSRAYE